MFKGFFTSYLISVDEHKMAKPKRTAILGSLIIKKLRNIPIISSNLNPSVDTYMATTDVDRNQRGISSHVNEMTKLFLSSNNNRSSVENNR